MSSIRARNLPRVREALEKAERARFYKQRTNKYTDEVRLVKALTGLENERIAALARIKEQTMDLRMQALHIKDEEKAFLEADSAGFDELQRKVEVNKQRNFLQEVKYKPRRIRDSFVRRYERWKAEDAEEEDWREEMPQREPKVRLNEQLIYPTKRERKQNRRQYMEITRRPDSKLGAKAILRLQDLYTDDRTDADRMFFEELELQLSARSEADSQQQQIQQPQQPVTERPQQPEASPFVTQQLGLMHTVQDQAMKRILGQIESTRRSIRFWEIPASEWTREKLDECYQHRRYKVRRRKQKPGGEDRQHGGEDDEGEVEDGSEGKVRFRQSTRRRMKKKPMTTTDVHDQTSSESDSEPATSAASAPEDKDDDGQRDRVRKLSKRLSHGFRADDFTKRRQSLMQELDEEGVSTEERQRRMLEFEKAWTEVLKCKYIRGYEPPDMRLPEGQTATDFVFGEAQARILEKIVEEAAAASGGTDVVERLAADDTDKDLDEKPAAVEPAAEVEKPATDEAVDEKPAVHGTTAEIGNSAADEDVDEKLSADGADEEVGEKKAARTGENFEKPVARTADVDEKLEPPTDDDVEKTATETDGANNGSEEDTDYKDAQLSAVGNNDMDKSSHTSHSEDEETMAID